ncbi:CCR4-NOT transcription complex subunit 7 [Halotydeus destructor]|nr:CCR4-NOT transcription complex subunit 7 [Halotydeus destructor]
MLITFIRSHWLTHQVNSNPLIVSDSSTFQVTSCSRQFKFVESSELVKLVALVETAFQPSVAAVPGNGDVPSAWSLYSKVNAVLTSTTATTGANQVGGNQLSGANSRSDNGANSNNPNGPNSPGDVSGGREGTLSGSNQSNGSRDGSGLLDNEACGIRDVWASNLEDEFKVIRQIITQYPFVAMDTEFPGVVARPIGEFKSTSDYQYQLLKVNVDLLKIIQLGLSFQDKHGKPRQPISTWQFNFKFNLMEDMFAQDSIDLLTNSGIQFKKHEEEGICIYDFAELLMTSGVVLNENIQFLSFHSGYDFGYLLKILTDLPLPEDESEFFELLRIYFPIIYDVKYLMKSCKNLKGGLQEVADQLELQRLGPQHQAGSDSLLTGAAFFKMREMFFEDNIDDSKYCGHLYGLGTSYVQNGAMLTNVAVTPSSTAPVATAAPLSTGTEEASSVSATATPTVESTA